MPGFVFFVFCPFFITVFFAMGCFAFTDLVALAGFFATFTVIASGKRETIHDATSERTLSRSFGISFSVS
jgi:hypothetical protein